MKFITPISINNITNDIQTNLNNQYNKHLIKKQAKNAEAAKYLLLAHNYIKNAGFKNEAQEIINLIIDGL